jgi:NAD(P)-dependent dehydrogenase (short-subunit alcohol dehydrogenase family)
MTPVTLITGATSGMGRSTALLLSRKGHRVFAGTRGNAEGEAALRSTAEAQGAPVETVRLDVTDQGSVDQAVRCVLERAGRIDNLVTKLPRIPLTRR